MTRQDASRTSAAPAPDAAAVNTADALAAAEAEVRELRTRKQLCARAFGPAKQRGDDLAPLKAEMQAITDALARAEAACEQLRTERPAGPSTPDASATTTCTTTCTSTSTSTSTSTADAGHVGRAPALRRQGPVTIEIADIAGSAGSASATSAAEWQRYVDAHPAASLYHDARWPRVIAEVFGHAHYALLARAGSAGEAGAAPGEDGAGGSLLGVLPLVRQRSLLFGDFLTSMPFLNYGGALADDTGIETELMQRAGELAKALGCRHVEFRDVAPRPGWPARTDKVAMHLALPADVDALSRGLGTKLRAQVRRPEREGASTRVGGIELVGAFYEVFCRNMRDLGTPVYPRRWFEAICRAFANESAIVVVDIGGRPVAAGFLLQHRDTVEIPWASTVRDYNRYGVNMALYWRCLTWSIERGARTFDFGRSSIDAGTHRFKAQWGAREVPLYWHYWLPDGGALPALNPQNAKYRLMIAAWQRLPVWASRIIGPPIVRAIP